MSSLPGPAGLPNEPSALAESVWRAPLVPVALAFTAGVVADRFAGVPYLFSLLLGVVSIVAFVAVRLAGNARQSPVYLLVAGVAFGAGYHHLRQELYPPDDIGHFVRDTPQPARLQGVLVEEPRRLPARPPDPLRSQPQPPTATSVLRVTRLNDQPVSGRVRLVVSGAEPLLSNLHAGDEVEVRGRMTRLAARANPGEFDQSAYWHDRGVHGLINVQQGDPAVRRLTAGWAWSPAGWVGAVREKAHDALDRSIRGESLAMLARALLLGEGAPMTTDAWAKYVRTGVVHVLAISGQHLVVVALFLWAVTRLLGVRQRRAAVVVALVLLGYALLTGGRPPALRSAVGACLVCGGLVLRRPVVPANLFALGWLVVGLWRPADLFEPGCQLSFLAVAVLCWGASWILHREPDPLGVLVERTYPPWLQWLRWAGWKIWQSYLVCFIVWVAITPLAAFHSGVVAPAALVLGPPLTLLTSIALLAGFFVLLLPGFLAWPAARIVEAALLCCEWLVDVAERWPTHAWAGAVPAWWVVVFYLVLLALLTHRLLRDRWRWFAPAGVAWLCLALLLGAAPRPANEMRVTFLAVGHGGAVVIELPDGRTVLYDAGSLRGPDVAARVIAPFLWSRKIQRLDDVILSHADLDHFNALLDLSARFAIGRVLTSDTFADRPTAAVALVRDKLRHLRWETLAAGDRLSAGGVMFRVLHPPPGYREGNENARSVVVELTHGEQVILLTGDLESEGLARLLQSRPRKVDILQAPHHGSSRIDGRALIRWCEPGLVVSCQGAPRGDKAEAMYTLDGVEYWTTHARGAVTVRSRAGELEAEAYHDGRRWRKR